MTLRNPNLFSPHRRILAAHQMGRYIMDIDQLVVNYARGFVLHLELKWKDEAPPDQKQIATIYMVANVWNRARDITRMYDDGMNVEMHTLRWKGYYIFQAGTNDDLTNDDSWACTVITGHSDPVRQYAGEDGAVLALSNIARGAM